MLDTLRFTVNNLVRADVNSESVWVDILNGREKLIIGLQYRPPNLVALALIATQQNAVPTPLINY